MSRAGLKPNNRAPVLIPNKPGRRYVWPPPPATPEHIVPSVTTILDHFARHDWLVPAAARRVAEYAVNNILQWESMPPGDAKKLLAGVARREWDRKADKGTVVHKAIDLYLDTDHEFDADLDPEEFPYLAGVIAFLQDHKVRKILHREQVVYNLKYDYAGRVDLIADFGGPLGVVDWKTGAIGSDMAIQVNAYAHGEFVGREDGTKVRLPPIDLGYVVQLPGDGTYNAYPVEINDDHFKAFAAFRRIQKWKDEHEDGAIGAPRSNKEKE